MPAPVLYRKWRPQTLAQVVGQEHVTRTLLNALTAGKLAHAYLFTGPRGTGKTSTARILAKAINCQTSGHGEPCGECPMCLSIADGRAMDIVEIDAASNNSVDDVRELRERVGTSPAEARYRVYIIDEVHMLSKAAFNALLKTLEEPPPHVIFVLATTEVHGLPATILSRCQRYDFHRIPQQALATHLAHICQAEGLEFDPEALDLIARTAAGGARDAVSLLEQVEVAYGGNVTLAGAQEMLGITGDPRAVALIQSVAQRDLATGFQIIQHVRDDGVALPQFAKEIAAHLRNIMLIKAEVPGAIEVPAELASELNTLAKAMPLDVITAALKLFGQLDFRADAASSLSLELALVDAVTPAAAPAAPASYAPPSSVQRGVREPASASPAPSSARQAPTPLPEARASTRPPEGASQPPPQPLTRAAAPRPEPVDPPPPSRPAAAPSPVPAGGHSIDDVRDIIRQLQIPNDKFIGPLIKSKYCTVQKVDGGTITLGFTSSFKAHKDRLDQDANRRLVEQAIKAACGVDYRLRVILVDNVSDGPNETPNGASPSDGSSPRGGHLVRAALN
ncbi:MAG: DNA polymerase III subunit gamma/tau, partial [Dehalococcoidia bacterium]|nr:DNA polymerase III subunit gamma/tau [Dehalococcoidia bacterium]